jgi:uncharacterized membrane protein
VLRGHAIVGLVFTVALGVASFVFHGSTASRAVCSVGAMACLFGAAAALNVSDRIMRGRPAHTLVAAGVLGLVAAALVAVSVMAWQRTIASAWSPVVGAVFVLVLAAVFWRLSRWKARNRGQLGR